MSFPRTLTRKVSRYGFGDDSKGPQRRCSVTKGQISSPVALISTTSMLTYSSAQSLRNSGSHNSMSSLGDSSIFPHSPYSSGISEDLELRIEHSHSNRSSSGTASSHGRFSKPLPKEPAASASSSLSASSLSAPMSTNQHLRRIPSAHAIRQYQRLSPQLMPPKSAREVGVCEMSGGIGILNPFGAELAQVAEMTEEIAGMTVGAAEEEFMVSHGLQKCRLDDYEGGGVFSDQLPPQFGAGWI